MKKQIKNTKKIKDTAISNSLIISNLIARTTNKDLSVEEIYKKHIKSGKNADESLELTAKQLYMNSTKISENKETIDPYVSNIYNFKDLHPNDQIISDFNHLITTDYINDKALQLTGSIPHRSGNNAINHEELNTEFKKHITNQLNNLLYKDTSFIKQTYDNFDPSKPDTMKKTLLSILDKAKTETSMEKIASIAIKQKSKEIESLENKQVNILKETCDKINQSSQVDQIGELRALRRYLTNVENTEHKLHFDITKKTDDIYELKQFVEKFDDKQLRSVIPNYNTAKAVIKDFLDQTNNKIKEHLKKEYKETRFESQEFTTQNHSLKIADGSQSKNHTQEEQSHVAKLNQKNTQKSTKLKDDNLNNTYEAAEINRRNSKSEIQR